MGSVRERVADVCEMFANELIKIIGKVKKREMLVPRRIHVGMTAEGSQRMIYELKVLYKRKES